MSEYVISAAKGSKKAMTALFEKNKNEIFALCSVLLCDEQKSADITKEVINSAWNQITVKDINTDVGFSRFLKVEAAKRCGDIIFSKDMKSFRVARVNTERMESVKTEEYCADIQRGINSLNSTLRELDERNRFVFLLKTAGNLSFIHIGQVIVQREAVARWFYESAVVQLEKENSEVKLAQIASLLQQYKNTLTLPSAEDEACRMSIKSRARFEMPSKRAITSIAAVLCFVFVSVVGISVWASVYKDELNQKFNGTSSGSTLTTQSTSSLDKNNNDKIASEYDGYVPTQIDASKNYYADITVRNYGKITVKLEPDDAPMTVANFVDLANKGFYNGLTFHRIIDGFMMQGGDPNGNGTGGPGHTIFGEFNSNGFVNELLHTEGAISMARSQNNNSAGSQFFIIHETSQHLDGKYAVFGYVTDGMDIVDKICTDAEPTDSNGTIPASAQPVIESIVIRNE